MLGNSSTSSKIKVTETFGEGRRPMDATLFFCCDCLFYPAMIPVATSLMKKKAKNPFLRLIFIGMNARLT